MKFWGVRGSIATGNSSYGSNTSCIEVQISEDESIFFDAGTGIRAATNNRSFKRIILCLSHFHWDHIQGLPFVTALNDPNTKIEIISGFKDMKERLELLFDPRFHPVSLKNYSEQIGYKVLKHDEKIERLGYDLELAKLNHPGDSYAFKLSGKASNMIYATDSDYDPLPAEAERLIKGAEHVVLDSQFLVGDSIKKADYGHSSFKVAIDVAGRLQVRNAYLFHFDPNYSDEELENLEKQSKDYASKTYYEGNLHVHMAKEGHSVELML